MKRLFFIGAFIVVLSNVVWSQPESLLYVAEDYGFVYVYDINNGHTLLRKFEVPGTGSYKGICADPIRGKLYLSSSCGRSTGMC